MDDLKIRQYQYLYNIIRLLPEDLEASKIEKLVFLDQLDKKEFIYTDYKRWYFGVQSHQVLKDIHYLSYLHNVKCNSEYDDDGELIYKRYLIDNSEMNTHSIGDQSLLIPNFHSKVVEVFFEPMKYDYSKTLSKQFYTLKIDELPLGTDIFQTPHNLITEFPTLINYFKEYQIPLKNKINEFLKRNPDYILLALTIILILITYFLIKP